jgi:hypothetical protein
MTTPEEYAQKLVEGFSEIVGDLDKAKDCSMFCVELLQKEADFEMAREWYKLVKQEINIY